MTAPQIPNLLERLRNSKAATNVRGLREGVRKAADSTSSSNTVIQHTDDDAAGSRMSAVDVGYLDDPYARTLAFSRKSVKRMPIINRGTYVRTVAIDALVKDFLNAHKDQNVQIISLGAGTDTRPFRLLNQQSGLNMSLVYHELDFAECTKKKILAITNAKLLSGAQCSKEGTQLTSAGYYLHPLDLRKLTTPTQSVSSGQQDDKQDEGAGLPGIDRSCPTLLLSECCFTYLSSSDTIAILQRFLQSTVSPSAPISIVLYEPLHPDDAFGQTMTSNLSARGISLPGLRACPTLEAHADRLTECGFEKTGGMLVKDWWRTRISNDEKERLRNLEGLDEEEEWELLAGHYSFIWGSRGHQQWPSV